jgi:hypothetical protein
LDKYEFAWIPTVWKTLAIREDDTKSNNFTYQAKSDTFTYQAICTKPSSYRFNTESEWDKYEFAWIRTVWKTLANREDDTKSDTFTYQAICTKPSSYGFNTGSGEDKYEFAWILTV